MSEIPQSDFVLFQKAYSDFRSRCHEHEVWNVAWDQIRMVKEAGMGDWDAKKAIMAVWEGCLTNLENGGRAADWDFDRMKPKGVSDKGAFEVSPIKVTRELTVYEMFCEVRARDQFLGEAGKTKEGPIESNNGMMIDGIKIKLKAPNSTVTRRQELEWVLDHLFEYQMYDDAKDMEGKKKILEQAPTPATCSWMKYASNNHTSFMKELPKLLPEEQNRSESEEASEVHLHKVLSDIEQTVKVVCPNCSSKF